MSNRGYDSVSELLEDLSDDEQFRRGVESEIAEQRLATMLFAMRNHYGLTQSQVAEAAGHTQSWVSKLEHSPTDKITVRDLLEYAEALQLHLRIQFRKPMTAVQSVKHHFFQIKKHLEDLRELAKGDEEIRKGVDRFHDELFVNTVKLFAEGKNALCSPEDAGPDRPGFEVDVPEELPDDETLRAPLNK